MALAKTEKRSDLPDDYLPRKASLENRLIQTQYQEPACTMFPPAQAAADLGTAAAAGIARLQAETEARAAARKKRNLILAAGAGTVIVTAALYFVFR